LKRRWTITLLGAALACAGAAAVAVAVHLTPVPARDRLAALSQLVVAENGELLRAYLAPDGQWRLATRPEDVDPRYLDVLLAYEDRRFYRHIGIDFLAFARVAAQFLQHGRITSGASTLTMQAVRLLNPGSTGLHGKITQLLGAIQLERSLSKRDILEIYLTLAPFGGNIEGVRAASLFYFGKEPNSLTLQESALLVAIAQAPARRRPDRHPLAAAQARDRVLARLEHARMRWRHNGVMHSVGLPLPTWGEGGGEGVTAPKQNRESITPSPHPSPLRGEGADRARSHSIPSHQNMLWPVAPRPRRRSRPPRRPVR
jgi:penicillin-binding protein 1C